MSESPPKESQEDIASSSSSSLEPLFESMVRVTLAGFGGSIAGLAHQQQRQEVIPRRGPPTVRKVTSVPGRWAISCMCFALILETSRTTSPTTRVFEAIDYKLQSKPVEMTVKSIGDYGIGGTVAGLAGAIAAKRSSLRPHQGLLAWGLLAGLAFGVLAGVLQAGIDVGNFYLEQEEGRMDDTEEDEGTGE